MITLDMKTVMFGNVVINFVCLIVLLILWYQNRKKYSGLFYWVLDWVLLTGGTLLITLQGTIPSWASMLLSNSMIIGGTFVLCFGLARFAGKKHNQIIISSVFVVLAVFIAVHSYFIYVHNDLVARSYDAAIGLALACALGTWLMFKGVSPEIRRISTGTGIAFAIIAFISFIRIIGFTLIPQTSNQFLQSGKFDALFVALLAGAIAYLVFNLVLMVNKRLYIEEKKAEENNVYLASFPEMNISPILELDQQGNIKYQNHACKRAFPDLVTLGSNHPFFASWTQALEELRDSNAIQPVIHDVAVGELVYEQAYFTVGGNQVRIYCRNITKSKKAEEKLADSEVRYQRLFETAQDAILILNGDTGQIIDANPFIKDLLGYFQEELLGKNLWEIGSLKDTLASKISYQQLHESGYVRYHHLPLMTKDGRQIDVEVVANAYQVDHKRIIQCNIRDITERKRLEAEKRTLTDSIQLERDRLAILINNIPDEVWFTNTEGKFVLANPSALEEFGFSDADMVDVQALVASLEIYRPDGTKRPVEEAPPLRALKGEIIRNQDEYVRTPLRGELRYRQVSAAPIKDNQGNIIGSISVVHDITERKRAEDVLKSSEERFRRLAENIPDVVYRISLVPARHYEYVSLASRVITGYTPEEYYANSELGSDMVYSEDKGLRQLMMDKPELYKGVPLVIRYIRKDGRVIWVERRQVPIYDEGGELIALEGIDRDVTEDIRLEEAVRMSEINFRNSIDSSPLGIRVVSTDGETIYANRKFLDIYGYENLAEYRSTPAQKRYTPESYRESLVRKGKSQRGEQVPENYGISVIRKDGGVRHMDVFRKDVLWGGEPQVQMLYNDVTERKRVEDQRKLSLTVLAMLNQPKEQKELIRNMLLALKEFSGCEAVGIRLHEGNDYPYYESNGFPEVHIAAENHLCARNQQGELICDSQGNPVLECMCGNIICGRFDPKKSFFTGGGSFWTNSTTDLLASTTEEDRQSRTRNRCNGEGYESVALIPLKTDHETIGLLQFNDKQHNRFTAELVHFYEGVGQSIGIALAQKRSEEALKASEENFRNSLDNSPLGIRVSNVDNNTLYVNQALLDIFGYKNIDEVRAKSPHDHYTPESYSAYLKMREMRLRGEIMPDHADIDIIRKDGTIRHLQALFKVILWGGKQQFQTLYNDLTQRKQTEEALTASEIRYRRLFEAARDGILILNVETGMVIDVNPFMIEMLSFSREEFLGKKIWELGFFKDVVANQDNFEELKRQKYISYENMPLETASGRRIQVEFVSHLYEVGNQQVIQCNIRDITARKQAEQALMESEEKYRLIVENSRDIIFTLNAAGEFAYISPSIKNVLGYSHVELVGRHFRSLIHPDDIAAVLDLVWSNIEEGSQNPDGIEYRVRNAAGEWHWFAGTGTTVHDANGNYLNFVAIARDITEQKQAEVVTRELEVMKQVDHLRSDLLANVSHELRTPLTSIKGYASTLLRTDVKWSAKQKQDYLQIIDSETDRLIRLINDILDVSRIDGGALKIRQEQCQISQVVESIKSRLIAITKNHRLRVDIPETLPAVFVDESRIGQVISNLVDNAVKFSPAGSEIGISASHDSQEVLVSVTDHGEDMSEEVMSKLFNRFYQAENVVSGRQRGTGLGLVICRGIVESHGGNIWVESKLGEGSKFSFSLPVMKEESNI